MVSREHGIAAARKLKQRRRCANYRNLFERRLALRLAGSRALFELIRERLLDALLPLVRVDGAVVVRVHRREGGLEARRDQQVLEVLVAAVGEELNYFFVCAHGCHL